MKKRAPLLALAALALTIALPTATLARSLDDYYYDDDYYYPQDTRYELYYEKGTMDENGVIQLNGGSASLQVGQAKDLDENRNYYNHDKELQLSLVGHKKWESKDSSVASVNSKGVVTAHKIGSTRVTVTYNDNMGYRITQTIRISVGTGNTTTSAAAPANSFEVSQGKRIYLADLLPADVAAGSVTWDTSKSKIATVDGNGLVLASAIGSCNITATYTDTGGGEHTEKFPIRVTSLLLDNYTHTITVTVPKGQSLDIIKMYYPNYAQNSSILRTIHTTSNNTKVASIDGTTVYAREKGSCHVTIELYDGDEVSHTQRIKVIVT